MSNRTSRSKPNRKAEWEARARKMRKQLETAWLEGEHEAKTLWHQSAIAALHWVSSNRSRMTAFRKSVKGTPVERAMNAALKAIRVESRAPAPRARARRKPAVRTRKARR